MTRQAKRYLEMYRVLDGITDEEDKQQVRQARQAQARQ